MVSPVDPHAPAAPPVAEPDGGWPAQAADKIVDVVDQVRSKTTGPALTAARVLVYGLIIAVLGVVVGVLFIIFAVRLLDELLPSGVWLPYLVLGLLFCVAGAVVFRRRKPPPGPG